MFMRQKIGLVDVKIYLSEDFIFASSLSRVLGKILLRNSGLCSCAHIHIFVYWMEMVIKGINGKAIKEN
jgi:hypothetical protein